jgi:hypothetical protein
MPIVNMDKEEAMNVEATFPDVSDSKFTSNLLFSPYRCNSGGDYTSICND